MSRKPKHEPGEYMALNWDEYGDPPYEVIHGHVDEPTIREVLAAEAGWSSERELDYRLTWGRFIPSPMGAGAFEFREAGGPGPGVFRVTMIMDTEPEVVP